MLLERKCMEQQPRLRAASGSEAMLETLTTLNASLSREDALHVQIEQSDAAIEQMRSDTHELRRRRDELLRRVTLAGGELPGTIVLSPDNATGR